MTGASRKIIRQEGDVIVVREALGQMVEYDVYRQHDDGENRKYDEYLGGGSKREALALFRRTLKAQPDPRADDDDFATEAKREEER